MADATEQNDLLLEVKDLKKYFPIQRGLFAQDGGLCQGGRRRQLLHQQGRDLGPGGRERLRQDHHRAHDPAPASSPPSGEIVFHDSELGTVHVDELDKRGCGDCGARCRSSSRIPIPR